MKTCVPSAPKALPRSRSGVKVPGRAKSSAEMFQTKNSVLPRTYSQRMTMLLWWAVIGRMLGGAQVLSPSQTIDREDALIAHTRKNAYFVFQENNVGSIQPGKLADLVVLDRDYLTIPAEQIKVIRPVLTMVGGKIVYDAAASPTTIR